MSNPDAIVAAPALSRGGGRSVAMFVFNDVTHDRRVLMEADALQGAGWSVTIHGVSADAREPGDISVYPSGVRVIRHETSMPMLKIGSATLTTLVISVLWLVLGAFGYIARAAVPTFARRISSTQRLVAWATRAAAVATGDAVFHLHDLTGGLPLILSNRSVHRRVVYDSHEIFMESNALARSPRILRWAVANLFERRVVAIADAFVTVNPAVQSELNRRYRLPEAQLVLYNCADPVVPGTATPSPLRTAIGVDDDAVVVLYHGGLSRVRGIPQVLAAARDPRLASAHFVFMGYGPMADELDALGATNSQIHRLPAVPPDELIRWISGASVGVMLNQAETLNERCSTPNKLFEAIAAELPIISSDFPERRRIILDEELGPLGAVCDPSSSSAIAQAIVDITMGDKEVALAIRRRLRKAASTRWNWQSQAKELVRFYQKVARP